MNEEREDLLEFARSLTRDRAGFILPSGPEAVEIRLGALARREGTRSAWELLAAVKKQPGSALATEVLEALAPRDTWFFRDRAPFQHLAEEVFEAAARQAGPGVRLRIWCAGCGSGQEAYSLAMLLEERRARGLGVDTEIVATDFSRSALRRAEAGVYDQFEVQRGLPIRRLIEHLEKVGEDWRINDALRRMIAFKPGNLLQDFVGLGAFDIVLLRHVLPHLAAERRDEVFARVQRTLRPGGWLMLGAWETAPALSDFDAAGSDLGVFRKHEPRVDRRVAPRSAVA